MTTENEWLDKITMLSDEEKFVLDVIKKRNPNYEFRLTPLINTEDGHVRGVLVRRAQYTSDALVYPWVKIHTHWYIHKLTQLESLIKYINELEDELLFHMEIEHRV